MYAREVDDKVLTFDFVTGLRKNNLLFVDRETHSLWSQLEGEAVEGMMEGAPLTIVPSIQTTWKYWKKQHPDSWVLVIPDETGVNYLYRNHIPGRPPLGFPQVGHDTSTLGLGIAQGDDALFLPWRRIRKVKKPFEVAVGGETFKIHVARKGLTAWAETESGELAPAIMAYKRGWREFHPKSRIYKRKKK